MPTMPVPPANMRIMPGEPAYLEVSIDPAAHGEEGLGPIQRGAFLKTSSGQSLAFDLSAYVER